VAGKNEEEAEITSGMTAVQLLQKLAGMYETGFREEIFEEDGKSFRDDLMLTLNEAILAHESAAGTVLKQSDVLALYPIFPGGG